MVRPLSMDLRERGHANLTRENVADSHELGNNTPVRVRCSTVELSPTLVTLEIAST
jgi:hypothetical protein